jgi:hypothetical protein
MVYLLDINQSNSESCDLSLLDWIQYQYLLLSICTQKYWEIANGYELYNYKYPLNCNFRYKNDSTELRFQVLKKVKQLVWFKNHTSLHYLAEPPPTSFPGSSLLWRKDPGWGWSRGTRKFDRPRGSRQSIKLHASTSAIYTSIARSESVLYNQLWESYKIQILAKFGSCLLLKYKKHAKHIFIATDKSGSQAIKTYDRIYALKLFSYSLEASGALSFHTFLFCLWFTSHDIYNILIICR